MSKVFIKSIGTVIPLGDGATGKSILTKHLIKNTINQEEALQHAINIKKSLNIELEYSNEMLDFPDKLVSTTLQYHVFPGQRQKSSFKAPTFDEIVEIFDFLPSLKEVNVLLMIYDSTRLESLKSLESWLTVALQKGWVSSQTKLILVANKIDLIRPNENFIMQVKNGIYQMIVNNNINIMPHQITHQYVSAVSLEGVPNLRKEIFEWVANFGNQRIIESSFYYDKKIEQT
jgi:GTPase SAR1 family protein